MKVLSVLAVTALLAMPAVQGCSMMPQQTRHEVVPVKQNQILSMTIIEGKTTKQEIINTLGTPSTIHNTSLSYNCKTGVVYQIHLIQKDGTQLDYEIAIKKKSSMSIYLDYNTKKIVREVSIS